jgi:hypothetical protein
MDKLISGLVKSVKTGSFIGSVVDPLTGETSQQPRHFFTCEFEPRKGSDYIDSLSGFTVDRLGSVLTPVVGDLAVFVVTTKIKVNRETLEPFISHFAYMRSPYYKAVAPPLLSVVGGDSIPA